MQIRNKVNVKYKLFQVLVKRFDHIDNSLKINLHFGFEILGIFILVFSLNGDFFLIEKKILSREKNLALPSSSLNQINIDVSFLNGPGVYEILDVLNNMSYYGESGCLFDRLQIHYRQLKTGNHFCKRLQDAFTEQQNLDGFKCFIVASGPDFVDAQKRRDYQDKLIEKNKHRCYNQTEYERSNPAFSEIRPIMYKGKRYESVRGALKDTAHGTVNRSTLRRKLNDPTCLDIHYIEGEGVLHGSILVFARKAGGPLVLLPSIKACVKYNFVKTIRLAKKNLEQNIDGWRYANVDKKGKPMRGNYILKEGEISYEMYLKNPDKYN